MRVHGLRARRRRRFRITTDSKHQRPVALNVLARQFTVMRHFLPAGAVVRLASGVMKPSAAAVLVASTRRPQRRLARLLATRLAAVAVATVAPATEEKDAAAVDTRADDRAFLRRGH